MKNPNAFNFMCRFHLGKGEHEMHWRIQDMKTGEVEFHDPNEVCFQFKGAFLRNQLGAAKKINGGANKSVCAWVECEGVEIYALSDSIANLDKQACYNPRKSPHWLLGDHIVDGESFDVLVTSRSGVYLPLELNDVYNSYECRLRVSS